MSAQAHTLAEMFARNLERWASHRLDELELPLIGFIGKALIESMLSGNSCITESALKKAFQDNEISIESNALWKLLEKSGLATRVGAEQKPSVRPLVIDAQKRLYLHRYYDHETSVAQQLVKLTNSKNFHQELTTAEKIKLVAPLFPNHSLDWQKIATYLSLSTHLMIISGGPGTGKTTTVAKIVAALHSQEPNLRVVMAAPTGKAAMRMRESFLRASQNIKALTQFDTPVAQTIHQLVGWPKPRYHQSSPLPYDVVIIDEASMLDLALADILLKSLSSDCRLILLGDKDQLSPIESGNFFCELSQNYAYSDDVVKEIAQLCDISPDAINREEENAFSIKNAVVWLRLSHRFKSDSGIGKLASDIRQGLYNEILSHLRQKNYGDEIILHESRTNQKELCFESGFTAYREALGEVGSPRDFKSIMKSFDTFRILCATKKGTSGTTLINQHLSQWLCQTRGLSATDPFFDGMPVMVAKNDYNLGLSNGDIGIVLQDNTRAQTSAENVALNVHFLAADGSERIFPLAQVDNLECAFAMTIHKSQGSEFDQVAILVPQLDTPVATRELLYTAVTRAKSKVHLFIDDENTFISTLKKVSRRDGGLLDRYCEILKN